MSLRVNHDNHGDDDNDDDDDDKDDDDNDDDDNDDDDKKILPKQEDRAGLVQWWAKPTRKMCTGLRDLLRWSRLSLLC